MIRVTVDSIRVSLLTQHRVVVLRETDSRRYLPIWIGNAEADSIALALQGHEPVRPLTHDLLRTVFTDLGAQISHIVISDTQDSMFFAKIVAEQAGRTIEIDARPSDSIALAVRCDAAIYVAEHVFTAAGVLFDEDDQPSEDAPTALHDPTPPDEKPSESVADEGLSLFRDFINTLDVDDSENRNSTS
jgi:hypothetical protein